jgi:hypothetical protein
MWTLAIVEIEIGSNGAARFTDALVSSQIHLLVFDASLQTLNEHVVSPSHLAIHADRYYPIRKDTGEIRAGELAALICVEDVRLHVHHRLCGFATAGAENIGRSAIQLRFSGRDLLGVHVELFRKLRKRSNRA